MAAVLVETGVVQCANSGVAKLSGSGKLKVKGSTVMRVADTPAWSIAGCVMKKPCMKIVTVLQGQSQKLMVQNSPALLATFQGNSDGEAPLVKAASAGQSKLTAS